MRANKAADCIVCNASKIEKIVAASLSLSIPPFLLSLSLFIFLYFALSLLHVEQERSSVPGEDIGSRVIVTRTKVKSLSQSHAANPRSAE